jgi:hypothetical protein
MLFVKHRMSRRLIEVEVGGGQLVEIGLKPRWSSTISNL